MNTKKITQMITFIGLLGLLAMPMLVLAQDSSDPFGLENINTGIQLGNVTPQSLAAQIINVVLGFLGIVAVVIILVGGFQWMTPAAATKKSAAPANELFRALSAWVLFWPLGALPLMSLMYLEKQLK